MAKPVLVVVADEEASRRALTRELEDRYGAHYRIVSSVSPDEALARLERLRAEGADVPLVLADQWTPGVTGAQLLGRVRELHPAARRVLLVSWGDQSAAIPEAAALGQIDFFVFKPSWSPDEQFHRAVTESLEAWWRLRGGQFATVTVIGEEPSGRVHEVRASGHHPHPLQRPGREHVPVPDPGDRKRAQTSTSATAPRSRAATATGAWNGSGCGTATPVNAGQSRPTGCSS
jgi:CheY-like chemotaxis protein